MELHNALRNIVQTDGKEILKDVRLVNILDDFNAYQDIPASKYILRAIIADGYTGKLLMIGKWDIKAETLVQKFSTITGFIPELVLLIFQSIAFGLGWINLINQDSIQNKQKQPDADITQPSNSPFQSGWRNSMTDDEKEDYIISLLDYDNSRESQNNVKLENISFEVNDEEEITMYCEFRRTGIMSDVTSVWLRYALYDLRGRMKDTGLVNGMDGTESNPKPVSKMWWNLKAPQISRIRLFWED